MVSQETDSKIPALLLKMLATRLAGLSDAEHVAQVLASTRATAMSSYLEAIAENLRRGASYGCSIAESLRCLLSAELQERLRLTNETEIDNVLLKASIDLLLSISDYENLRSIFDRAGYRYSRHRAHALGPGPYDIDLYTAVTESHPDSQLTGETVNVSFSFESSGRLHGVRSYSMGEAPANPLQRGGETPAYAGIEKRQGPRRSAPMWWLRITTPARDRRMEVTRKLVEFMQGWAMQANGVNLDFEGRLELRGRAHPLRGVKLIEIADGSNDAVAASDLSMGDYACMQRLISDRHVTWCLHSLVSDVGQDVYPYNCFLSLDYPNDPDEIERAKATYLRERTNV